MPLICMQLQLNYATDMHAVTTETIPQVGMQLQLNYATGRHAVQLNYATGTMQLYSRTCNRHTVTGMQLQM